MGKGSTPTTQNVTQTTSNIGEAQRPYYNTLMQNASSLLTQGYNPYEQERIAGFTPEQQQVQQNILNQQTPGQFGAATQLGAAAGLGSLMGSQYGPSQFNAQQIGQPNLSNYVMQNPGNVQAGNYQSPEMQASQTGFQPNLNYFQMGDVRDVGAGQVNAPTMQGAQTSFGSQGLEQYRVASPDMFGLPQAQQYMSPYAQSVMDVQKREAIRDAKKAQLVEDLGAARQGTYGGSRQLLAGLERERQLGQNLGDIEAKGMQSAYENAQAQFERDRAAGMTAGQQNLNAALQQQQLGVSTGLQAALANLSNEQQARVNNQAMQFQAQGMNADNALKAALANQGVDVTRGQQNLAANLQTQGLGAQYGTQLALANLDARSQANVQNLAAQLQTQGLNADQALRAALANQQMGYNVGQQNLQSYLQTQQLGAQTGLQALQANQQANLEAQRLAEQSRQFGANLGLQGLAQTGQMAQTLGNLGQMQGQSDLARLNQQQTTAAQQQALQQQYLDTAYQDYLRQQNYPMQQLQQYANLLSGVPAAKTVTETQSAPAPSLASQIMGTGLGALGMYKTLSG